MRLYGSRGRFESLANTWKVELLTVSGSLKMTTIWASIGTCVKRSARLMLVSCGRSPHRSRATPLAHCRGVA